MTDNESTLQNKKRGRPKREGGYSDNVATQYLELCKTGKSLSQIASEFKVTEKELIKWTDDPRKSKLRTVWELGRTFCKAYHENLLEEMIRTKSIASHQINSQQHRMAVMFKDWNLRKETKVTVDNKFDSMSEEEISKELQACLRRKNNKALILDILNLHKDANQQQADTIPPPDQLN